MLNYFRYKKQDELFLLTNDMGNYTYLTQAQFDELTSTGTVENCEKYQELEDKGFLYSGSKEAFLLRYVDYIKSMKQYTFRGTSLHIFVVTTACNGDCIYCQAKSDKTKKLKYMTKEIAKRAVDIAVSSPETNMSFEFQGGEPLLNFDIIKYIVLYTKSITDKNISFNIVSNLTMLTQEMIDFIKENNINISTSLDGSKNVHNHNRPFLVDNGSNMYDSVLSKIKMLKGNDIRFGAIETTTNYSIKHFQEIIDEYISQGLTSIFIRPLTPLGMADHNWKKIGYDPNEFIEFYKKSLEYILKKNIEGYFIAEGHSVIFLRRILQQYSENYMDLRSPCGAAIGQLAYFSDGDIYTCDEGRMLAEMGDDTFKVGDVFTSSYSQLIDNPVCKAMCKASITEAHLSCSQCVYQSYCGVCPVVNYAENGDLFELTPNNYRCQIYKGMLDVLFELLRDDCYEEIFYKWLN